MYHLMNINNNLNLEFQLYDWLEDHITNEDNDSDDNNNVGNYIIHAFGRCENGQSVYAKILGFTPYFYVLIPEKYQSKTKSFLEDFIKNFESSLKSKENKKIYYKYKDSLQEIQLIKQKRAEGFNNDKEYYFARLVFNNADGFKKYRYFLESNDVIIKNNKYKFKLYEANLLPMLRCFHIREISGCSWIETNKYDLITDDEEKESRCDIEINVDWRNLIPIKKDFNAPFKICSFDIECYSIDGEFPQAKRKGDSIIQIGATYTTIGTSNPYRQYIACLNNTNELDNIIVESYESEQEVIYAFLNEINSNDCDIITGYNIFFFDENYIYDRCKNILNINISYMSKLKKYDCPFTTIKLASSSLNENILKYWNTPGRVHIDLMKDVQKTFNLESYKLDYVASNFIKGNIKSFCKIDDNKIELMCDTVQDIFKSDYIHLEVTKGFISNNIGNKYLVNSVDNINNTITILETNNLLLELEENKNYKINWSQAKDDLEPKDIFKLYKGSEIDRSIIAKYCIKDCKLVNLLINKLETITKNIEMSNVCYIPLSFLFTRGQGIKIQSLCLREYRLKKYVFPIYKLNKLYHCLQCNNEYYNSWECPKCKSKKRDEIENESTSYEGAIVFDPVPKVEYEAVATKDYMSLYPSSIMHKNMSHETIVEDSIYDNLSNVKYYDAQFKDSDGSIQYRRFAQIENKLGVIPTILDNLLKERKQIKKKMKIEKDPFKYKILDAKQFAVKTTANSLYGQLGAPTSSICKRDIAACTTSTGREMLILAKKYDEEILPVIINSLKYHYKNNDTDNINKIYDIELKNNNDVELLKYIKNFIYKIKDLTIQPIVRYGDTDSIFSCYRFRENIELMNYEDSLYLWKKIVNFGYTILEPFFSEKYKDIFYNIFQKYYSSDKIIDLKLPQGPTCNISSNGNSLDNSLLKDNTNNILLPIEYRMEKFIKEYMEESYIPWLWTLSELVEKNFTYMFDIKLIQWAEHLFLKMNLICVNLYENRKKYLCEPIINEIKLIFKNGYYYYPSDETINNFTEKILNLPYKHEIKLSYEKLKEINKNLLEKTIKEKWIYSNESKELSKIINNYLLSTTSEEKSSVKELSTVINYIKIFLKENNNLDINTLSNLLITNLNNDKDMNCNFNIDNLNLHTKIFIEKYNKHIGKKTIEQIIEEYIEHDLLLSFNSEKIKYFDMVTNFIKSNMRKLDMSNMDNEKYIYYWIQPRCVYNENLIKEYIIDIYEGGNEIIDKRSLEYTIDLGKISGELVKSKLPNPHDLEYEKTYWPIAFLRKKKYVGNKYEFDINKFKLDFMGIVLKRRDNAPIVKELTDGVIDYLINKKDPNGAKKYLLTCIQNMFDGKYEIKYFLQSRTIKSKESYKDWQRIAHIYLADKISKRDPGNIPQSGDRIEYAVVEINQINNGTNRDASSKTSKGSCTKLLQGDIIETPQYIKNNNLKIDYLFYLTNQIMNPVLQFLELVDKNFSNIFNDFITKYSHPKIIKEKPVKIIKEKPVKIIKEKPVKIIKEKPDKIIKENKAIDILIEKKNINNKLNNYKYILQIKKLLHNIQSFDEENNYEKYFITTENYT
uniref:DNA-directed DNA polymerase n=1 Tax=viral metagenome TaxID=1070528 RepID=A0A6C0EBU1_9ZZZZ